MSSTVFDVIGLIGSFIISAALVPQIRKVYRTKSAQDISYPYMCMYITGLTFLAIYGIGESLWPIYIPSSLELLGAVCLLTMKFHYDRSPKYKTDDDLEAAQTSPRIVPSTSFVPVQTPK